MKIVRKFIGAFLLITAAHTGASLTVFDALAPGDDLGNTCAAYLSGGLGACYYDTYTFTVSQSGDYAFEAFYPGELASFGVPGAHLDGILVLVEGLLDPNDPFANVIRSNDDSSLGANYSTFTCGDNICDPLTAGTIYTIFVSSWADRVGATGQSAGDYRLTITGIGDVSLVPVPAAIWFLMSGLVVLGFGKSKKLSFEAPVIR